MIIKNPVIIKKSGGGGEILPINITQNGLYLPPSGVDGYSPVNVQVAGDKNANIHWHLPKICKGDPFVTVHSDCELKDPLTSGDFSFSANILSLTKVGILDIQLSLDKDNMEVGDIVTFSGNQSVYKFENGIAEGKNVLVEALTVNDTYESLLSDPYKRNVVKRMTAIRDNVYLDDGTDTLTYTNTFPRVGLGNPNVNTIVVDSNSAILISGLVININQRDAGVYYVWQEEGQCDSLNFMKVRWKGSSHYSGAIDQEWEAVFLSNGDVILRLIQIGINPGGFSFYGQAYTPTVNSPLCFYRKDYWGTNWDIYTEAYTLSHHHEEAEILYKAAAFSEYATALSEGTCCINFVAYDDNDYTINFDSTFNWHWYTSVTVSGNSWMGLGGASEHVRMHRRDSKMYYLYICYYLLTDMNNMKAVCISWRGASHYNIGIDRWWTLWLFENGDAMIYISTVGSNTGDCYFFDQYYSGADNSFISFYYNSGAGNYDIKYERYTLEHHIG